MGLNKKWLNYSYWVSGGNWNAWAEDFEFSGAHSHLPVLTDIERYRFFVRSYGLLRYSSEATRLNVRRTFSKSARFRSAIKIDDGSGVDTLAVYLRDHLGTGTERSLVSKLAAFARPDAFIAWDQYARKGVARLTNGPTNGSYTSYKDYLSAVNTVSNGVVGARIRDFIRSRYIPTTQLRAFERRVLDVYLMLMGGRWPSERRLME